MIALLVDGLGAEDMSRGGGGCGGALLMTPKCGCVVGAGEYCALPYVKTLFGTLFVEDAFFQIKILVCYRAPGVVRGNLICDHIRREIRCPHCGMRSGRYR